MERWTGDFFVLKDGAGQEYVSAELPAANRIPQMVVKKYRVTGKKQLVRIGALTAVNDAGKWVAEKEAEGFTFAMEEHR